MNNKNTIINGRVPLRINRYTIAYVRPENCNEQYAQKLRKLYDKAPGATIPSRYLCDYT